MAPECRVRGVPVEVDVGDVAMAIRTAGGIAASCLVACLVACAPKPVPAPASSAPPTTAKPAVELKVDHALPAFGGRLLGTDRGEWIGDLYFEEADGGIGPVLHGNILALVRNEAGVFAFTGLRHMGIDKGDLYEITRDARNDVVATRVGRFPGMPRGIVQQADGRTTFLVGGTQAADGRDVLQCLQLSGRLVEASSRCEPLLEPY